MVIGSNVSLRVSAGDGIRTHEHLRDWTLNPAPLTWLGNPRKRGSQSHAVVVFNSIRHFVVLCASPVNSLPLWWN